MNIKQRKEKKISYIVVGLAALIQLFAAILYGTRAEWFRFGLFLTGGVIMIIFSQVYFLFAR